MDITEEMAETIARQFHEAYERLAPSFGYETREASAVPWVEVPEENRRLMIAVAGEVAPPIAAQALRRPLGLTDEEIRAALGDPTEMYAAFDAEYDRAMGLARRVGAPDGEVVARRAAMAAAATVAVRRFFEGPRCNCMGEWWGGEHVTGCPMGPTRPRQ